MYKLIDAGLPAHELYRPRGGYLFCQTLLQIIFFPYLDHQDQTRPATQETPSQLGVKNDAP